MTGDEFRDALETAGLKQAGFIRMVRRLSGEELAPTTVFRWIKGDRAVPPLAAAAIRLFQKLPAAERAELLDES